MDEENGSGHGIPSFHGSSQYSSLKGKKIKRRKKPKKIIESDQFLPAIPEKTMAGVSMI